jgi:hypothetical protein
MEVSATAMGPIWAAGAAAVTALAVVPLMLLLSARLRSSTIWEKMGRLPSGDQRQPATILAQRDKPDYHVEKWLSWF